MNELNMKPVRWLLIFTIVRGLRLLHDVRLLPKPNQPEEYAKQLWTILLTVLFLCVQSKLVLIRFFSRVETDYERRRM